MKGERKQREISSRLLNSALHYLGELNVPFALVIENVDTIFSNTHARHAIAIVEDKATFTATLREKGIEAKV